MYDHNWFQKNYEPEVKPAAKPEVNPAQKPIKK